MRAHKGPGQGSGRRGRDQGEARAVVPGMNTAAGTAPSPVSALADQSASAGGRGRVVDEVLVVDPTLPGGISWAGYADILMCAAPEKGSAADSWAAQVLGSYPGCALVGVFFPNGGIRGWSRTGSTVHVPGKGAGQTAAARQEAGAALVAVYARWFMKGEVGVEGLPTGVMALPLSGHRAGRGEGAVSWFAVRTWSG